MKKKTTGQRLLAARTAKKLSLREMAKLLQVPMSNYNDWEHDSRFTNLNLPVAKRLRKELGVKLHQLRPDIWTKQMDETL